MNSGEGDQAPNDESMFSDSVEMKRMKGNRSQVEENPSFDSRGRRAWIDYSSVRFSEIRWLRHRLPLVALAAIVPKC